MRLIAYTEDSSDIEGIRFKGQDVRFYLEDQAPGLPGFYVDGTRVVAYHRWEHHLFVERDGEKIKIEYCVIDDG